MVSINLPTGATRLALSVSHLLLFASSAIVVAISGYFLKNYPHDQHLIFHIVIAASTLGLWLPSFVAPFFGVYKQYYLPLNFIFSYLWLTSFIFAAQDYNEASCRANAPTGGSCTLKLVNEAFIFLGLSFTIIAFLIDVFAWRSAAVPAAALPEKEVRHSSIENQA